MRRWKRRSPLRRNSPEARLLLRQEVGLLARVLPQETELPVQEVGLLERQRLRPEVRRWNGSACVLKSADCEPCRERETAFRSPCLKGEARPRIDIVSVRGRSLRSRVGGSCLQPACGSIWASPAFCEPETPACEPGDGSLGA